MIGAGADGIGGAEAGGYRRLAVVVEAPAHGGLGPALDRTGVGVAGADGVGRAEAGGHIRPAVAVVPPADRGLGAALDRAGVVVAGADGIGGTEPGRHVRRLAVVVVPPAERGSGLRVLGGPLGRRKAAEDEEDGCDGARAVDHGASTGDHLVPHAQDGESLCSVSRCSGR